jgi:hypothetical protein
MLPENPTPVGIRGNKKLDALAKQSLSYKKTDLLLPACVFGSAINKLVS